MRFINDSVKACWMIGLALGLGVAACTDEPDSCATGTAGCECFDGNLCLVGLNLTCLSNVCVSLDGADTNDEISTDAADLADDDESADEADFTEESTSDESTSEESTDDDPTTEESTSEESTSEESTSEESTSEGPMGDPCGAGAEELLFTQDTDPTEGYALLAGYFSDFGGAGVELADDFTVPAQDSCWCITQVVVRGLYDIGIPPLPDVRLEVLDDANGKPALAGPWSYEGPAADHAGGVYTVELPPDSIVESGKNWLSFRPELNSEEAIWYWYVETVTSGSTAHARDQSELVFQGCSMWMPGLTCYDALPPDYEFSMQFDIYGVVGGSECD